MSIPLDTRRHVGVSAAVVLLTYPCARALGARHGLALVVGALLAVAAGAAKELLWDKALGKGKPEWRDFGADLLGTALGLGLVHLMHAVLP